MVLCGCDVSDMFTMSLQHRKKLEGRPKNSRQSLDSLPTLYPKHPRSIIAPTEPLRNPVISVASSKPHEAHTRLIRGYDNRMPLLAEIGHPTYRAWLKPVMCLVSRVRCLVSGVSCPVSSVRC